MVKAHTSYVLIYGKNNDENEGYSSTWHRAHVRYVAELQIAIRIRLIEKNRQCSTRKYVMQSLISMEKYIEISGCSRVNNSICKLAISCLQIEDIVKMATFMVPWEVV